MKRVRYSVAIVVCVLLFSPLSESQYPSIERILAGGGIDARGEGERDLSHEGTVRFFVSIGRRDNHRARLTHGD